jgi:hypothetical protein
MSHLEWEARQEVEANRVACPGRQQGVQAPFDLLLPISGYLDLSRAALSFSRHLSPQRDSAA